MQDTPVPSVVVSTPKAKGLPAPCLRGRYALPKPRESFAGTLRNGTGPCFRRCSPRRHHPSTARGPMTALPSFRRTPVRSYLQDTPSLPNLRPSHHDQSPGAYPRHRQ